MERTEYEEILKEAINGEIEAQEFYQSVADKMDKPYLKELFTSFVTEEKKHQQTLEELQSYMPKDLPFDETRDYKVAETFDAPEKLSTEMKPADAFALAMKKEESAMKHYQNLAEGCTDPDKKRIFRELAAMEREHKRQMEKAFVDTGFPEVW